MSNEQLRAQGVGIGGERSAEDAPFCVLSQWIFWGRETGVCPPQARSTKATRVAYL